MESASKSKLLTDSATSSTNIDTLKELDYRVDFEGEPAMFVVVTILLPSAANITGTRAILWMMLLLVNLFHLCSRIQNTVE